MAMKSLPPCFALTSRERDIVRGIMAGRANRDMASDLGITQQAVKNILWTLYQKCHVRNRLQLGLFAVRHKLLSEDNPAARKDTDQDSGNFSLA